MGIIEDDNYRKQARECEECAARATSELERAAWQRLADGFRNLVRSKDTDKAGK